MTTYIGRFAPSPTGRLHQGSLAALLASWLDARAHAGKWILRIEDIDPPRDVPGAGEAILEVVSALGLSSDEPVVWQHDRYDAYEEAFEKLLAMNLIYPCTCSRKEAASRAQAAGLPTGVYPGTCRSGAAGGRPPAWRFNTSGSGVVSFRDRLAGSFSQDVEKEVGDFVVKRADGLWAYQLAVVVDDIASAVTHVVRGADLIDNTPRQMLLYGALGAPVPQYMHIPLVLNSDGEKLSKQTLAPALELDRLPEHLEAAFVHLGFPKIGADSMSAFYKTAVELWKERFHA